MDLASGEWLGWLNADEFYLPGAVSAVREVSRKHPEADVIFGDSVFVDEIGCLSRYYGLYGAPERVLRTHGCILLSCSVFIRRRALSAAPWDTAFAVLMDWDLFLGLADRGARFAYTPQPLGAFRVHAAQVTAERLSRMSAEHLRARQRHGLVTTPWRLRFGAQLGRGLHVAKRAKAGSLRREARVQRALRGQSMRWFSADADRDAADTLLALSRGSDEK
jgi:hypothetical protein